MNELIFDQQLALSLQRLEELWQQIDELPPEPTRRHTDLLPAPPQDLLKESLEGLSVSLQELQVAAESLRQEKEELALSLDAEAAECQRYQELFKFAPDGYLVTTKDGTITQANQTVAQLLNIAPDRLITKPLVVFVDPQERRDFYAKLSQLQKGESLKNWQIQLQRWRDAFFKVSCTVTPIKDHENHVVGLRWQLQDLTPSQEAETARQHEALFRAMFENAATGIVILDSQGNVIKSNHALEEMLGYTSQDLETVLPQWLNLDKSGIESVLFQQLIAGKRHCYQREKCYNAPDKSRRWGRLTYSLVQGAGNQPAFATCMLEDITELHQLRTTQQEALKQELVLKQLAFKPSPEPNNSIERLEAEPQQIAALVEQLGKMLNDILSSTPEFFFVYDATGKYIYVNRSAAQALGLTQSDFISKTWQQLKLPAEFMERLDAQRASVFNNGQPITDEASFATVEGIRDYEYTISPLSDLGSQPEAVVVTVRDISEQKRAAVAVSEAMAKEEEFSTLKSHFSYFASVITQELRNPLNNIFACTKLIENNTQPEADEKTLSYLHLIQVNVRRMNQLLNDLLLIKKVEANELHLNPSLLNLTQFCQDLTEELQQGAASRHTITFNSQEQCAVNLDKKLLRHVLTNLLLNAIKYSPEASEIKLDVSCQDQQVILRIQDSGSDIPQADQDLLFKMFNQNGKVGVVAGSGLGLLIVKQCIDLQGGEIAVESTPGVGTTLTVTLPLHD